MSKRLIKFIDIKDEENFVFLVVDDNGSLDNLLTEYRRGGMTRFDLLQLIKDKGMECTPIFPEDYEEVEDEPSSLGY